MVNANISTGERRRRVQQGIQDYMERHHPMTEEEAYWLPQGVRLARLIPRLTECNSCNLAWEDHTRAGQFPERVCLKDLLAREGKNKPRSHPRHGSPGEAIDAKSQLPLLVETPLTTPLPVETPLGRADISRETIFPFRPKDEIAKRRGCPTPKKKPIKRSTWRRPFSEDHPGIEILIAMSQGRINREQAIAILEHFRSVEAFEKANLKERMKVPGVGKVLAKRFDYFRRLPYP